jgi:hypothetical protein
MTVKKASIKKFFSSSLKIIYSILAFKKQKQGKFVLQTFSAYNSSHHHKIFTTF